MDGERNLVDTPRLKVTNVFLQVIMSLLIPNFGITIGIIPRCPRLISSYGRSCMEEYSQARIWKREGLLAHLDALYVLLVVKLSLTYSCIVLMPI